VVALAQSPDYAADGMAFAATRDGRLWCTTDRGSRWESVAGSMHCPLAARRVVRLAVSPHFADDALVLAGADDGTVARSVDSGWSWEVIARIDGVVTGFEFATTSDHERRVLVAAARGTLVELELDLDVDRLPSEHVAA
jgi:photosystem II stability/assembly factor-like uncharacterized protein